MILVDGSEYMLHSACIYNDLMHTPHDQDLIDGFILSLPYPSVSHLNLIYLTNSLTNMDPPLHPRKVFTEEPSILSVSCPDSLEQSSHRRLACHTPLGKGIVAFRLGVPFAFDTGYRFFLSLVRRDYWCLGHPWRVASMPRLHLTRINGSIHPRQKPH